MGKIPDDPIAKAVHKKYGEPISGFMVIGTQNDAKFSSGRRDTSLASKHRTHYRKMCAYPTSELIESVAHIGIPLDRAEIAVNAFLEKQKNNKKLTPRNLFRESKKIALVNFDEFVDKKRESIEQHEKIEFNTLISQSLFSKKTPVVDEKQNPEDKFTP